MSIPGISLRFSASLRLCVKTGGFSDCFFAPLRLGVSLPHVL